MRLKLSQHHRTVMKCSTVSSKLPQLLKKINQPGRVQKQTWRLKVRVGIQG